MLMTPAGSEPAQLALVELESTPLDHSGKLSLMHHADAAYLRTRRRAHACAQMPGIPKRQQNRSEAQPLLNDIHWLTCRPRGKAG